MFYLSDLLFYIVDTIAYSGLFRLRQLPPGFLDILATLNPVHFDKVANFEIEIADVFKHIYNQVCRRHGPLAMKLLISIA